jgi:hypothetical protein
MPEQPMMKGAMLRACVDWYEERYGEDALREIAARASEELRAYLDPDDPLVGFLPASWYPAPLVHELLDVFSAGRSEAEIAQMAKEATRAGVVRGTNSVYRFVLARLVSPEIYARTVPRLWRQLHTTGERRVRILGPGEAESVVTRWHGHHPLLCTITIETMCALFESMGAKDVTWNRVACVSRGAEECVTRLSWR